MPRRITFWDWVRSNLRDDTLNRRITRMEKHMATAAEQLEALHGKVDDVIADVRAALDILRADRENLTEAGQAALDSLNAKVEAFDVEIGDADNSDTPPVEEPPVDPGEPTDPAAFRG
ncbi:hypothetical protein [Verrucosispora sp. WMMC514]|uniref:hypothetical protein n=1 Tax=Verrucosispora sp. WMMC514 TaxID=3015156 RepID=UPI00248C7865|nr:hypothetical protein [Verrucosispora sp. WMMC514]WBB94205.1 hypothetical protein O7597_15250 [Verrucosispora sp. WMMC514]